MRYKTITIFLLMLMLGLSSVIATDQWEQFGKDRQNTQRQDPSFISEFSSTDVYSTISDGVYLQPLIVDIDGDGTDEIIGWDGNYLKIYNASDDYLRLENEMNIGALSHPFTTVQANESTPTIVFGTGGVVYSYTYDGSTFSQIANASFDGAMRSGISCYNFSGTYGCYFASEDGNITEYNAVTGGLSQYNITDADVFDTQYGSSYAPWMWDIDNDGNIEMGFMSDNDGDLDEGMHVIDQNTMAVDILKADNLISGASRVMGSLTYNLDGAGTSEWCYTVGALQGGTQAVGIECYNSDGSTYFTDTTLAGGSQNNVTHPFIADLDATGQFEICLAWIDDATSFNIECFDGGSGTSSFTYTTASDPAFYIGFYDLIPSVADMDADGYEDIIISNYIFFSNGVDGFETPQRIGTSDSSAMAGYHTSLGDVNSDGFLDIVGQKANSVFVALTNETNAVPTLTHSYGQDWVSPICNGTTVTFTAKQYTQGTHVAGTNYYNDVLTDTERLVIDCQGNDTLVTGSYHATNPTMTCTYNTVGSYTAEIYIEDNANPGDRTQYDTVSMQIIDGVAGVTCNLASLSVGGELLTSTESTGLGSTQASASVSEALNYITGGDQTTKYMVSIIILLAVLIFIGMKTGSALIGVIATVVMFILLTAIGLLPVWILIVTILFLTIGTILLMMLGGGSV